MDAARQLLSRAHRERDQHQRVELLHEAATTAADQGDGETELEARIALTSSASHALHDNELTLTSFGASLALYDSDRARFGHFREQLYWQYKWIAPKLAASPDFALDQVHAVLDDMESHYLGEGLPLAGVYTARFEVARLTGDSDGAAHWLVMLRSIPRDEFSDCAACERSAIADDAAERSRDTEVLTAVDEVLAGSLGCTTEPAGILGLSLGALRRAGRDDDAARAFNRVLGSARRDPLFFFTIPALLRHLTVSGDLTLGLTLLERHGGWVRSDPLDVLVHLRFLTAASALLAAVTAAGHGATPVNVDLEPYVAARDEAWRASELAAELELVARRLAARFDTRNGNSAQSSRIDAVLAEAAGEPIRSAEAPKRSDLLITPAAARNPDSAHDWLVRAQSLEEFGCLLEAGEAASQGLRENPDPVDRAALLRIVMLQARATGDAARARAVGEERIAALLDTGLPDEAEVDRVITMAEDAGFGSAAAIDVLESSIPRIPSTTARARLTASLAGSLTQLDPDRSVTLFREAAEATQGQEHPLIRARYESVQRGVAHALLFAGRVDDAEAHLRALHDETRSDAERAGIALQHAAVLAAAGRPSEALTALDGALRFAEELDVPRASVGPLLFAAQLHLQSRAPEQALAATTRARQFAARTEGLVPPAALHAQALQLLGRAEEGIGELLADLDRLPPDAQPTTVAEIQESLGNLFLAVGEPDDARESFVAAAAQYRVIDDQESELRALLSAAEAEVAYGSEASGIEKLRMVVQRTAELGLPGVEANARRALAGALAQAGDEEALVVLAEAVDSAQAGSWEWAYLLLLQARTLDMFDRPADALTPAQNALDAFEQVADDAAAADAEFVLAAIADRQGRTEDVVRLLESALARSQNQPGFVHEATLRLADALETLGRTDQARTVRESAETWY
jgi:tetratricopeptide (TPR) repeat protein